MYTKERKSILNSIISYAVLKKAYIQDMEVSHFKNIHVILLTITDQLLVCFVFILHRWIQFHSELISMITIVQWSADWFCCIVTQYLLFFIQMLWETEALLTQASNGCEQDNHSSVSSSSFLCNRKWNSFSFKLALARIATAITAAWSVTHRLLSGYRLLNPLF